VGRHVVPAAAVRVEVVVELAAPEIGRVGVGHPQPRGTCLGLGFIGKHPPLAASRRIGRSRLHPHHPAMYSHHAGGASSESTARFGASPLPAPAPRPYRPIRLPAAPPAPATSCGVVRARLRALTGWKWSSARPAARSWTWTWVSWHRSAAKPPQARHPMPRWPRWCVLACWHAGHLMVRLRPGRPVTQAPPAAPAPSRHGGGVPGQSRHARPHRAGRRAGC